MVKQILTSAGFVEGETFKETRFIAPPKSTYAIYHKSYNRRGGDNVNLIKENASTIELYEYTPDPDAEARIESSFDQFGMEYDKAERYWIESEQLYQVVYDFTYIEK